MITPELGGLLAVPEGNGPWPAVVMVHEVFGIDDNMRAQITRLAQAGYVVLMPDLYSSGGARKCLTATFKALAAGTGQAFTDIETAKALLTARPDVTDKVGVIGFCMGGGFALLLANKGYDAAASNYGMLPKDMDAALDATLTKLDVVHDIKMYSNSGHAFMNPQQGGGPIFGSLLRVTGAKPNPEDAKDAWLRIEDFFKEHLGS